jgi:TetR/AcrR family transcriptional regulator
MVNRKYSSEEKILEAAKEVFHKRGFDGARMQDIADAAGINKALVHYYFRNKENLFLAVFKDAFSKLTSRISIIFTSDKPMETKLEEFFEYHIGFVQKNAYIAWFILNGIYERPDYLKELMFQNKLLPEMILQQIRESLEREGVKNPDPFQFMANILSLSVFPVVARPLLQGLMKINNDDMELFYKSRVKYLPGFVMRAVKNDQLPK